MNPGHKKQLNTIIRAEGLGVVLDYLIQYYKDLGCVNAVQYIIEARDKMNELK